MPARLTAPPAASSPPKASETPLKASSSSPASRRPDGVDGGCAEKGASCELRACVHVESGRRGGEGWPEGRGGSTLPRAHLWVFGRRGGVPPLPSTSSARKEERSASASVTSSLARLEMVRQRSGNCPETAGAVPLLARAPRHQPQKRALVHLVPHSTLQRAAQHGLHKERGATTVSVLASPSAAVATLRTATDGRQQHTLECALEDGVPRRRSA